MVPAAGLPSLTPPPHSHHFIERQSQVCQIFHVIVFLNFVMVKREGSGGAPRAATDQTRQTAGRTAAGGTGDGMVGEV